jgi:hypothetical protein
VDIPLLYTELHDEDLVKAYKYYELWYEAPGAVKVPMLLSASLSPSC